MPVASHTAAQAEQPTPAPAPAPFVKAPRPQRILIIGGGVAGLAALRALHEEGPQKAGSKGTADGDDARTASSAPFERVELIERRDDVGGVWYLDDATVQLEQSFPGGTADGHWPIVSPHAARQNEQSASASEESLSRNPQKPLWPSPAYPALRGNVLPRFLSFSTEAFPQPGGSSRGSGANGASQRKANGSLLKEALVHLADDPYPTLDETHTYLRRIARPLRQSVRTGIECLGVWELEDGSEGRENRWAVRICDWNRGGAKSTEYWDAVVSAVGWTDKPIYPRTPGLDQGRKEGLVDHCKWYRGPEPYAPEQRICVVGNGNSGNDVAAQVAALRTDGEHEPVYRVVKHKAPYFFVSLPDPRIRDVPAMERIVVRSRKRNHNQSRDGSQERQATEQSSHVLDIHLVDGSVIRGVDKLVIAAGYEIGQVPFVHVLNRGASAEERASLPHGEDADWDPRQLPALSRQSALEMGGGNTRSDLWRSVSQAPPASAFDAPSPHCTNPPRISGLWQQLVHARAATLAFINLTVSSIPFSLSDLQAHVLRVVWDGSAQATATASGVAAFPSTLDGRLASERARIEFMRQDHAEAIQRAQEAHAVWETRMAELRRQAKTAPSVAGAAASVSTNGNGAADGDGSDDDALTSLPLYEPPEPTGAAPYHVVGTRIAPYLGPLREMAVAARPEWDERLPRFGDDEQLLKEHFGMYRRKYESLQARRAAAAEQALVPALTS